MAFRIVKREFKYRNAESTDVRLTFARIRREQRRAQRRRDGELPEGREPVRPGDRPER